MTGTQTVGPTQAEQEELPFAVVQGVPWVTLPKDLYIPPDALEVFLDAFEGFETIVAPSSSCTATIRHHYPALAAESGDQALVQRVSKIVPRVYDLSEFLVDVLETVDVGAYFPHKVTYHDGCHGLRELNLKKPARQLLEKVRGLQLVEMKEAETCCGFGGTFSTKFPMISTAMGEVKCASARDTTSEYLVSGDSSCLMHLQGLLTAQKQPLKTIHIAEVLTAR